MVSSQFIPITEDASSFLSTRHIPTKKNANLWLQKASDSTWVKLQFEEYDLINNSLVTDEIVQASLYIQVELRVADTEDELGISPADITIVSASIVDVNTVADNIDSVNINAENIVAIQNAEANAQETIDNLALTNADVVLTHADVLLTHEDVRLTGLDVDTTNADVLLTHEDVRLTGLDVDSTSADVLETQNQVGLATAQVVLATAEADRAEGYASIIDPSVGIMMSLPASKLVVGDVAVVGIDLVITDRNMLFSQGATSTGGFKNTSEAVIGNETIPTSIFAGISGDCYVKKIEGGSWVATTNEPSFGVVSATSDYFLPSTGKWYDNLGVEYTTTITYIPYKATIASEEVVDVTAVDMPTLVTEYVKADFIESTGNVKIVDFGTVFNNNRYVIDNPFGNENYEGCIVRAEIQLGGIWGETGWYSTTGVGRGVKGYSNLEGLVVQTGQGYVVEVGSVSGGSFSSATGITSAPCRVLVTYVGVAQ